MPGSIPGSPTICSKIPDDGDEYHARGCFTLRWSIIELSETVSERISIAVLEIVGL